MKLIPICALVAAASLGFVACDQSPENKAAERQADAIEDKADAVRKDGENRADGIEKSTKDQSQAVKKDGDNAADATRKATENAADNLEKKADAVRDAGTPAPAPAPAPAPQP